MTDTTVEVQRVYPGKVDINRLQIKLLDEYGRIVDLDNMDYSISLKLEIADDESFKNSLKIIINIILIIILLISKMRINKTL